MQMMLSWSSVSTPSCNFWCVKQTAFFSWKFLGLLRSKELVLCKWDPSESRCVQLWFSEVYILVYVTMFCQTEQGKDRVPTYTWKRDSTTLFLGILKEK